MDKCSVLSRTWNLFYPRMYLGRGVKLPFTFLVTGGRGKGKKKGGIDNSIPLNTGPFLVLWPSVSRDFSSPGILLYNSHTLLYMYNNGNDKTKLEC